MAQQRFFGYGWFIVGIAWLCYGFGIAPAYYSWGIFAGSLQTDLGYDRGELGAFFGLFTLLYSCVGPLVGISQSRFGIRWTMTGGFLCAAAGLFITSRANTPLEFYTGFSLLGGAGVGFATIVPNQTLGQNWFIRRRALAIALIFTSGGIVGKIVAFVNRTAVGIPGEDGAVVAFDWRAGWLIWAGASLTLAFVAAIFVRDSPDKVGLHPDGDIPDDPEEDEPNEKDQTGASNYKSESHIRDTLAEEAGIPVVDLSEREIPDQILHSVDSRIVQLYRVVPIEEKDDVLVIATSDPSNRENVESLQRLLERPLEIVMATPQDVTNALAKYYDIADTSKNVDAAANAGASSASSPSAKKSSAPAAKASPKEAWTALHAMGTPQFAIMVLCGCAYAVPWGVAVSQLSLHLQDVGFEAGIAAAFVGTMALISIAGRLGGALGDWFSPQTVLAGSLFLEAVGMALLLVAKTNLMVYLCIGCIAMGFGTAYISVPVVFSTFFGRRAFGMTSGARIFVTGIYNGAGPWVAGTLFDLNDSYTIPFIAMSALAFAGTVGAMVLRDPGLPKPLQIRCRKCNAERPLGSTHCTECQTILRPQLAAVIQSGGIAAIVLSIAAAAWLFLQGHNIHYAVLITATMIALAFALNGFRRGNYTAWILLQATLGLNVLLTMIAAIVFKSPSMPVFLIHSLVVFTVLGAVYRHSVQAWCSVGRPGTG